MWKIALIIIFIPLFSFSKKCKDLDNSIQYHFINGVGNDSDSIRRSLKSIMDKLDVKVVTSLINPRNNEDNDYLHREYSVPVTWAEIKEVFSQKFHESLKDDYIVDESVVRRMFNELSEDKVNIVFSHSQGSLYNNSLCKFNNNRKKQKNIAIATPASSVQCGDKEDYVTLTQDLVIKGLGLVPHGFLEKPLRGNVSVSHCKNDTTCHGLIESYLGEEKPLQSLKKIYNKKIEQVKKEELDFYLVNLKLTQILDKDKNLITQTSEYMKEKYSSLNLGVRRNIASVKTVSYLSKVFDSNFMSSLLKLNIGSLNKKDFQKVLNTEIDVSSDREYADVVGYILDTLHPYCLKNKKYLPKNLAQVCDTYVEYYSPVSFAENPLFYKFKLESDGLKWDQKTNTLSLTCLEFIEKDTHLNKDQKVNLNYIPNRSISYINVDDLSFNVYPRNILNKNQESENLLNISFYQEDNVYKYKLKKLTDKINFVTPEEISKFKQCNTLNKLINEECKSYFINIMSYK